MQQQQIDGSYQELEPKVDAYSKEETLTDFTRNVLGLPLESVPDDAFLALTIGTDSVAYRVKVVYPNGKPAVGFTVGGIDPLPTTTLITDSNGIVLGKSTKNSVNITIAKKYDDVKEYSGNFNSVGTLTNCNIVLEWDETVIKVGSSKTITPILSSFVSKVEWVIVGGGGGSYLGEGTWGCWVGGGGGRGYAAHSITDFKNGDSIKFTIRTAGKNRYSTSQQREGRSSTITIGNFSKIVQGGRNGSSGSQTRENLSGGDKRVTGTGRIGGKGNGNGATGAQAVQFYVYDPDGDSTYTTESWSKGIEGTAGEKFLLNTSTIRTGGGGGSTGVPYYSGGRTSAENYYGANNNAPSDVGRGGEAKVNGSEPQSGAGWYYFIHN